MLVKIGSLGWGTGRSGGMPADQHDTLLGCLLGGGGLFIGVDPRRGRLRQALMRSPG